MNVRLTAAMLCLLPIYRLLVRGVSGGYRRSLHEVAETGGRLSGKLHETLDGISEVKNLGAEEQRAGDVICASEELARATMRQGRIAMWAGQGLFVIGNLASALAVYVAGRGIVAGDFTFGGYTAFVAYMGKLLAPIGRISGFGFVVQPSLTALERLSEFLDESTEDERYSHLPAPAILHRLLVEWEWGASSKRTRFSLKGKRLSRRNHRYITMDVTPVLIIWGARYRQSSLSGGSSHCCIGSLTHSPPRLELSLATQSSSVHATIGGA